MTMTTIKYIFTKEFWHTLRRVYKSYFAAIFTNRAVLTSIGFTFGGILASNFFNFIELLLYESFGSAIFQIATVPNVILACATFGGFVGFFMSGNRAAKRWGEEMRDKQKNPVAEFPDKLPAGTLWNQVYMRFLDEKNVFIAVREFRRQANYIEMGFADKRGKEHFPNKQWELLIKLAKKNGAINWDDKEMDFANKKRKQSLSEALQAYFGLKDDPFYPYENEKSYRIRMTLSPPPEKISAAKKPDLLEFARSIQKAKAEEAALR